MKNDILEQYLAKNEGKTLEFKENTNPLHRIIQTVIAFANTAGGTILFGIKDQTKEVVGLKNIFDDEEKLMSAISDSISPLLLPSLQLTTWRQRDILIVTIPHSFGPYFLKLKGEKDGVFIRIGSTNRQADAHMIVELRRLKEHTGFDQLPETNMDSETIDFKLASQLFKDVGKSFTKNTALSLELLTQYQSKIFPTKGGLLLFGKDRDQLFIDPLIRLVRFEGTTKAGILDHQEIKSPLPVAVDQVLAFIRRNTSVSSSFESSRREDISQYPAAVVREAVINALVHSDYSNRRASIQIAIFDDRLEITNPGPLPLGLSLEAALSGISQLRNKVLGRVFRELQLIEQWGSGLGRMLEISQQQGVHSPKFEELDHFFRVTLYPRSTGQAVSTELHHIPILDYIHKHGNISGKIAQNIWNVSRRTTTNRLKIMVEQGILAELATGPRDPQKLFVFARHGN